VALYGAKRALIRPDQHVAWRGDAWPEGDLLLTVSGRAEGLSRSVRAA
jgi:hypothetical protein